MKKINFNKSWEFTFENALDAFNDFGMSKYTDAGGAPARCYPHSNWERVDLPHDWAVALPKDLRANTFAGARANSHCHRFMSEHHSDVETVRNIGWYRKTFDLDPAWKNKRVFVEFEGIYRDASVWVNGVYLDRHLSGYTSFILEITDHLVTDTENSIAVRVDSDQAEGWWYEGSGIYRNVHLLVGEPVYFVPNRTVIKTAVDGTVSVSATLMNDTDAPVAQEVRFTVCDGSGVTVADGCKHITAEPYSEAVCETVLKVDAPKLWHVDHPYLYTLRTECGEEKASVRFGIRTVAFDTDRGFLLNGEPLKIRGACEHQDFGGVGVALSDNLQYYKIAKLKEMGMNAYRSAHHAAAPALLDACDTLGMLVMDETRLFGTSPEALRQLRDLVERDRNHPSVFIWSIGNEEFSVQNLEWSKHLAQKASRILRTMDDTRPITYGGNNGANFIGANAGVEVRGINYIRNDKTGAWIDDYHREHPDQPIIGTEESSYVLSRGGDKNDLGNGLLDATGNVTMPWGSTPKGWVKYSELRPYFAGSFIWTGFDYRGEPNPFIYSNVASSFGTLDLCGMEKPPFYYYKAWWTDEDVLHLAPHWNYKDGETAEIAVFTNCDEVALFVNGRLVEAQKVERFDAPLFRIPFEAGVLSAEGKRNGETVCRAELRTAKKTAEVRTVTVLPCEKDGDIGIVELEAVDENGIFCPTASDRVELTLKNGRIIGVGNGDPADLDYEQKPAEYEELRITQLSSEKGLYSIPPKTPNFRSDRYDFILHEPKSDNGYEDDFRTIAKYKSTLEEPKTVILTRKLTDAERFEYIEFERLGGDVTVCLNGEVLGSNRIAQSRVNSYGAARPYRFYCDFKEGENELKIVAVLNEHDPAPVSGEVKLGRRVETPWQVRLHYGRARVFLRSDEPESLSVKLTEQ